MLKDNSLISLPSLLPGSAVFENMVEVDYAALHSFAMAQGVVAIVWDEVLRAIAAGEIETAQQPSRAQKMQWAIEAENIVNQYQRRKHLSIEIADIWAEKGIKTYGLKGWALSTYYPKPELRECGDFDCWLGNDFQRGNQIAIENGAAFDPHDYRHSHINFKGLIIENHRYFLLVRGNSRNKRLERYLLDVISNDKRIENSNIYYPNPQFHALFIILHMLQHFLYENISIRHMLDWTYFVNAEKDNINWREFNQKCEEAGATRFVEALNHICIEHFGLNVKGTQLNVNGCYAGKILNDTLFQSSQHVSGMSNLWVQRYAKVKNIISQRWKFNEIYDTNFVKSMAKSFMGIVFESNVEL